MTSVNVSNILRLRYITLLRGLKLEIDTGMSIGRRSASAILKDEFGWPKNMPKKTVLVKFTQWCMDNAYPFFNDIVYKYEDELTGKKDWRYLRRGEAGYYAWTPEFTEECGKTAEQVYEELVGEGLTDEIISDMEQQSMFGWRED